jgi:hypothetical protein
MEVADGATVHVGLWPRAAVGATISVGIGAWVRAVVGLSVAVAVGLDVGVSVRVAVAVLLAVGVGALVELGMGVLLAVGVSVRVAVGVGVLVAVELSVGLGLLVAFGSGVARVGDDSRARGDPSSPVPGRGLVDMTAGLAAMQPASSPSVRQAPVHNRGSTRRDGVKPSAWGAWRSCRSHVRSPHLKASRRHPPRTRAVPKRRGCLT